MSSSAKGDERDPLISGGGPRDYSNGDLHNGKSNGDSPLLSILGAPHSHSDVNPTNRDPFSLNAGVSDFGRTRQASDAVSVTSFGGSQATTIANDGDMQNLQDVLISLEKASTLIRGYLRQEELLKRKPVRRPLIPQWVTKYLLIITFIWQTLNIGFLEIVEHVKTDNSTKKDLDLASNVVMTAFQAVHILLVFFVSFKLAKQVLHRSASGSLLAQSYLSMVLLFAGLYTLQYRFNPSGFVYVYHDKNPILLFLRMLYFSVSTATLCGTSEVEPHDWYSNLTVSLQMLMSFVYFASILSLGLLTRKANPNDQTRERSFTNKIRKARQWMFGSGNAF